MMRPIEQRDVAFDLNSTSPVIMINLLNLTHTTDSNSRFRTRGAVIRAFGCRLEPAADIEYDLMLADTAEIQNRFG